MQQECSALNVMVFSMNQAQTKHNKFKTIGINTHPEDEESRGQQQVQQKDQTEHVVLLVTRILCDIDEVGVTC